MMTNILYNPFKVLMIVGIAVVIHACERPIKQEVKTKAIDTLQQVAETADTALISDTLAVISDTLAQTGNRGTLIIQVQNIESREGILRVSLWNNGKGWPKEKRYAVARQAVKITGNTVSVSFPDVPYGNYAVALFHDLNSDKEYDRGIGETNEPYGFSSNAKATFKAPDFEDAEFKFTKGSLTHVVTL